MDGEMNKRKNRLFRVSVFFVLFPFSFIAGPGNIVCQDFDPDDGLDLFGVPKNSAASATAGKDQSCDSNFCSETDSIQHHALRNVHSQPLTSEPILLVSLRC